MSCDWWGSVLSCGRSIYFLPSVIVECCFFSCFGVVLSSAMGCFFTRLSWYSSEFFTEFFTEYLRVTLCRSLEFFFCALVSCLALCCIDSGWHSLPRFPFHALVKGWAWLSLCSSFLHHGLETLKTVSWVRKGLCGLFPVSQASLFFHNQMSTVLKTVVSYLCTFWFLNCFRLDDKHGPWCCCNFGSGSRVLCSWKLDTVFIYFHFC